jgi:8-oxo-dGTP diphosphatase
MNNPQKILKNRYQVVARTLTLLFDGDRVLLQKGSENKMLWAGLYNGLGGHIERREDVISSAKREIFEESGLTVNDLRIHGVVMIDVEPDQGICMFVCTGHDFRGSLRESDEGKLEWVKVDEINRVKCVEDLPLLIPRILEGSFFSLQYLYDEDGQLEVREGK